MRRFIQSSPVLWRHFVSSCHEGRASDGYVEATCVELRTAARGHQAATFWGPWRWSGLVDSFGQREKLQPWCVGCWSKNPQQIGDINQWIRFNPKMVSKKCVEIKWNQILSSSLAQWWALVRRPQPVLQPVDLFMQSPRTGSRKLVAWRGSTATAGNAPSLAVAFHRSVILHNWRARLFGWETCIKGRNYRLSKHNWEQHGTSPPIR